MNDHPVASKTNEHGAISSGGTTQFNLAGCLAAMFKRWYLVLIASIAAALLVGGLAFHQPRRCKVTYAYTYTEPDASSHEVFLYRFYSAENINRLVSRLKKSGLTLYAAALQSAITQNREQLRSIIDVRVWPKHTDMSSRTPIDAAEAEAMRNAKPDLTLVTITAQRSENFDRFVGIVRENIEVIMPMYMVRQQNEGFAREQHVKIAALRADQQQTTMTLATNRDILKGLQQIPPRKVSEPSSGLTVQFAVERGNVEHLPISYQIRTVESGITRLEAQQTTNDRYIASHEKLLVLVNKLLAKLNGEDPDTYTILEYEKYLLARKGELAGGDRDILDYLESHLDSIHEKISLLAPTVDNPQIVNIPRNTVRKTIVTFFIALAISVALMSLWARRGAIIGRPVV